MATTGIAYEKLTQLIFQELLSQDQAQNIRVDHNVKLQGKSTRHQIDVFWEFEIGGIKYSTVVQAKDWMTAVYQRELLEFKAVLDDLPGQPRGVFVTKTGYQSSAKKYAEAHGIALYELREATVDDNQTKKTVILRWSTFIPCFHIQSLEQDKAWVKQEKRRLGIPDSEQFSFNLKTDLNGQLVLYDEEALSLGTVHDVLGKLFDDDFKTKDPAEKLYEFKSPVFAKTDLSGFTRIRIKAVKAIIEVRKKTQEFVFMPDDFVKFVLKDVTQSRLRRFNKDGKELKE